MYDLFRLFDVKVFCILHIMYHFLQYMIEATPLYLLLPASHRRVRFCRTLTGACSCKSEQSAGGFYIWMVNM